MTDLASLRIAIDSKDLKRASIELQKLEAQGRKTERTTKSLSMATTKSAASFSLYNTQTLVLSASLALLGRASVTYADEMTQVDSKLKLVTSSAEELASVQQSLFEIAQESRVGFTDTVDLYSRMARSTKELSLSSEQLLLVTDNISKSLIISGGSQESANAALVQLGQGFASGTLRGEELNSVLEQTPRLARMIADGMGIAYGSLRLYAAEGKITSEVLIKAISSQTDAVNAEFENMTMTVEQSLTRIDNSFIKIVGQLNDASGLTNDLANAFSGMSGSIDENASSVVDWGRFTYATIDRTIDIFNLLWEIVENGTQALVYSLNLAVYGFGAGVSKMVIEISEGLNSVNLLSDKQLEQNKQLVSFLDDEYKKAQQGIIDGGDEILEAMQKVNITVEERMALMAQESKLRKEASAILEKALNLESRRTELTKEQDKSLNKMMKAAFTSAGYQEQRLESEKEYLALEEAGNSFRVEAENRRHSSLMFELDIKRKQAKLIEDSDLKAIATAEANYEIAEAELDHKLAIGDLTESQYAMSMSLQNTYKNTVIQDYTYIGQAIRSLKDGMESEFGQFFDYLDDGFMDFGDLAKDILHQVYTDLMKMQFIQPATSGISSFLSSLGSTGLGVSDYTSIADASSFAGYTPSAKGNMFAGSPSLSAFSNSVVSKPTTFAFATGGVPNMGVMGEKNGGSPEAIMPLSRMSSGNLGVETTSANVSVTIVNNANAEVSTQEDNDGNITVILDAVANSINRGTGNIGSAMESTFGLSR